MDQGTEPIPMRVYEMLEDHEDVEQAFPIALGDTYRGFSIVGTSRNLMDYVWHHPVRDETKALFTLADGEYFGEPMEAVVGHIVARQTGLEVGDEFVATHGHMEMPEGMGHSHEAHPYTVVGVLGPADSPTDRAIFTPIESVHHIHEHDAAGDAGDVHEDQVTSILVSLETPGLRFQFQDWLHDQQLGVQSVVPVVEIQKLYNQALGAVKNILLTVGYLVVVISALSILIGLYMSIIQRKRDIAIMRALGAGRADIVGSVLIEAVLITLLGIAAGYIIGNLVTWLLGQYLVRVYGLKVGLFGVTLEEIGAFAVVATVGFLAGTLPAWQAYRADVAHDLAEL
jgi:putative ABC transport system permease protein